MRKHEEHLYFMPVCLPVDSLSEMCRGVKEPKLRAMMATVRNLARAWLTTLGLVAFCLLCSPLPRFRLWSVQAMDTCMAAAISRRGGGSGAGHGSFGDIGLFLRASDAFLQTTAATNWHGDDQSPALTGLFHEEESVPEVSPGEEPRSLGERGPVGVSPGRDFPSGLLLGELCDGRMKKRRWKEEREERWSCDPARLSAPTALTGERGRDNNEGEGERESVWVSE